MLKANLFCCTGAVLFGAMAAETLIVVVLEQIVLSEQNEEDELSAGHHSHSRMGT